VENNAFGTLERLGITYEMLKEERPGIIYCRLPGYGKTGPYAERRALGTHIAAQTGDTVLRWYPGVDLMTAQMRFHSDTVGGVTGFLPSSRPCTIATKPARAR